MARTISRRKIEAAYDRADELPYVSMLTRCWGCGGRKAARAQECEKCQARHTAMIAARQSA